LEFTRKSPKNICNEDIKKYLEHLVNKELSKSTLSLVINSLKFYYKNILRRRFFFDIRHPKKEKRLPVVLSRQEIKSILNSIFNKKHQLVLALMYAAGLRISQVVELKIKDLDFEEGIIRVNLGKDKKDRQTIFQKEQLKI
jgi:site-specific recombinase XerD